METQTNLSGAFFVDLLLDSNPRITWDKSLFRCSFEIDCAKIRATLAALQNDEQREQLVLALSNTAAVQYVREKVSLLFNFLEQDPTKEPQFVSYSATMFADIENQYPIGSQEDPELFHGIEELVDADLDVENACEELLGPILVMLARAFERRRLSQIQVIRTNYDNDIYRFMRSLSDFDRTARECQLDEDA